MEQAPTSAWGRRARLNYRIFMRHGDLLDTTNKRFLLTSMAMTFQRDASRIEPIRIKKARDRPTHGDAMTQKTDKKQDLKHIR